MRVTTYIGQKSVYQATKYKVITMISHTMRNSVRDIYAVKDFK